MDLFTPQSIQATLEGYDKQEQEMQRVLASLALHGPEETYEEYKSACTNMKRQINMRRRLFKKLKQQLAPSFLTPSSTPDGSPSSPETTK
jgi:hypothetical protein